VSGSTGVIRTAVSQASWTAFMNQWQQEALARAKKEGAPNAPRPPPRAALLPY
jgi:hypothetical protein